MPSPTRPGVLPIWTVGNTGVRTQPTNGEQFAGFVPNFRPPAEWHNWLFGVMSDWTSWLDYATQGNMPVSNVGHNIALGTTVQEQLDEFDAFLSSLGFETADLTATGNPAVFSVPFTSLNGNSPIVLLDGLVQILDEDYTFAVVAGLGTVTFAVVPDAGQNKEVIGMVAVSPGSGGSAATGGFVVYGSLGGPLVIDPAVGYAPTTDQRTLFFVASQGGAQPITANPQIAAGTKVGQELRLVGTSDTDYSTIADGNGLSLNGPMALKFKKSIDLWWDGSTWTESDRK